jgi:hypothetical protein
MIAAFRLLAWNCRFALVSAVGICHMTVVVVLLNDICLRDMQLGQLILTERRSSIAFAGSRLSLHSLFKDTLPCKPEP